MKIKNQENCYIPEENLEKSAENVESFEPLDIKEDEDPDEITLPYSIVGSFWDSEKIISENFVLVERIAPWIYKEILLTQTTVMEVNPIAILVYGFKTLRLLLEEFEGGGS